MSEDKDRLGDRLHEREKAEEESYFAKQNRAALDQLRRQQAQDVVPTCPRCGERLLDVDHMGVKVARCPAGHGMWLDDGELQIIAQREKDSWLARILPKLG